LVAGRSYSLRSLQEEIRLDEERKEDPSSELPELLEDCLRSLAAGGFR
jgi:hypothetical protein